MILHRITLHHFCAYYGDQTLELPSLGDRTLTVVVGPNNSGKTSIIRGLKFWFYGEAGVPNRRDLPTYLCNRAKAETEVGQVLQSWVEVSFERTGPRGKETFALRRVIEAKRVSEDLFEVRSVRLLHARGGNRTQLDPDEGGKFQRMIESMVPQALFDAFYFKGEPLDGKLLGDVSSIRSALGQFLHEDQWKEAENDAAAIRDDLSRKLTRLTAANVELTSKLREAQLLQTKLDAQRQALKEEEDLLSQAKCDQEVEMDRLAKLGDVGAAKEVKSRYLEAKRQVDDAVKRLRAADEGVLREVNQSLGISFLLGAVEPVREILSEMEKENILPADISEPFIDRVLARSTCICGKKHDGSTRENWEAYRKKTLATDASEGLRKLLDWVKPTGSLSLMRRSGETIHQLSLMMESRVKAVEDLNEAQVALNLAQTAMEAVPHEEIARIGAALRELKDTIRSRESRIQTIEKAVHGTAYTATQFKDEIERLSAKGGVDQTAFKKLSSAKDRAERLHQALKFCRGRLSQYFHRVLQASVADFYDSKSTDGSKAEIDRSSLLPSIQVGGQRMQNLGGGQSQLLALAYVVSLARLRQSMHAEMETLGVRLGKIDDLSFFMDSPFGNMEKHYKEAALQLVPGSARQVIVLLWKEEWDFSRPFLEKQADAIYAVEFRTTADDVKKISDEHRTYSFESGDRQLIQSLPEGEDQPISQLVRI